jgi:4-hydroxybenzoate polyprenyltransferase
MVGVGLVLPLWNLLAHTQRVPTAAVWAFGGMMLGALASAVASGLSDEASDREGGKRTFATALGNARARALTEASLGLAAVAFLAGGVAVGSAALVVTGRGRSSAWCVWCSRASGRSPTRFTGLRGTNPSFTRRCGAPGYGLP